MIKKILLRRRMHKQLMKKLNKLTNDGLIDKLYNEKKEV